MWCYPQTVVPASFNTVTLFNIDAQNADHFVNMVSSRRGHRFALSGWYHTKKDGLGVAEQMRWLRRAGSSLRKPGLFVD